LKRGFVGLIRLDNVAKRTPSEEKSCSPCSRFAAIGLGRKGWSVQEAERWLAPILKYDPKPAEAVA
jgi:hypothetical protein